MTAHSLLFPIENSTPADEQDCSFLELSPNIAQGCAAVAPPKVTELPHFGLLSNYERLPDFNGPDADVLFGLRGEKSLLAIWTGDKVFDHRERQKTSIC